jgi:NAD(P)-dependent dehydrogenase (short-subunit alcohol dehydrogenase family)
VTSVAGFAGLGPYCASRGGIKQLTMSLADDWGKHGITVNCLAPGWFKTEQNKILYEDKEWVEYLMDRIPLKRHGEPHDLDGAVVFLASESSRYITGQTLAGGWRRIDRRNAGYDAAQVAMSYTS